MAPHAYQSLEPGAQIVISDEPREDLEELARWEKIPVPEQTEAAATIPDGEPAEEWKAGELKAYAAREEIDLGSAKNKGDVFAAITAALAAKKAAAETGTDQAGDTGAGGAGPESSGGAE